MITKLMVIMSMGDSLPSEGSP